jgi:hypothetical protein
VTSTYSVHDLWGWTVVKKNIVSATGTLLATSSKPVPPSNSAIGQFTVVWDAAT